VSYTKQPLSKDELSRLTREADNEALSAARGLALILVASVVAWVVIMTAVVIVWMWS
jgi:CHASE3 domain sensor protein